MLKDNPKGFDYAEGGIVDPYMIVDPYKSNITWYMGTSTYHCYYTT